MKTLMLIGLISVHALAVDLNSEGFKKLQKKEYIEAEKLFVKSINSQPKNPYAYLNLARVKFATLKDRTNLFDCLPDEGDEDISIGFEILSLLSQAVEIEPKIILEKLKAPDKELDDFKKDSQYERWLIAANISNQDLKNLLTTREWFSRSNDGSDWNRSYKFNKDMNFTVSPLASDKAKNTNLGKWSLDAKKGLILNLAKVKKEFILKRDKHYFSEGKKWFFYTLLSDPNSPSEYYIPGPRIGDCGNSNY